MNAIDRLLSILDETIGRTEDLHEIQAYQNAKKNLEELKKSGKCYSLKELISNMHAFLR